MSPKSELKYFTRNGNVFTMKKEYGFGLIIVAGLSAAAVWGYFAHLPDMIWVFGILALLCFLSIFLKKVVIDLNSKEIITKNGLVNPAVHIPLSDFQNFELVRTQQYWVTINTSLNIRYLRNGKEKYAIVAQGFTSKAMQRILNEITEILDEYGDTEKV